MAVILGLGVLPPSWPEWVRILGVPVLLAGGAVLRLGRPHARQLSLRTRGPRTEGELVKHGPYRFVRHPVYGAGLLVLLGYGLLTSVVATAAIPARGPAVAQSRCRGTPPLRALHGLRRLLSSECAGFLAACRYWP